MTEKSLTEEIRDIRAETEQIDRKNGGGSKHLETSDADAANVSSDLLEELRRENEILKAHLTETGRDVTQTLIRDQAKLENEIRANPLQSILIAGLAGFVAANLFSRPGRF